MERDYWRYREAETRYRHLFETTAEAVLIIDGSTQKVLEANPAARTLCGARRSRLVGAPLSSLFEAPRRTAAEPGGCGTHGGSPGFVARAAGRRR
jgi:PAS domain-containing protein